MVAMVHLPVAPCVHLGRHRFHLVDRKTGSLPGEPEGRETHNQWRPAACQEGAAMAGGVFLLASLAAVQAYGEELI